ncbi:hypothetical protein Tco_1231796 [Tanacetum coccineum]
MMDADVLLAERLQQKEREQFTIDEQARMLVDLITERKRFFVAQRAEQIRNKPPTRAQLTNKMINDFVPMDSEMVKDSGKKDDDKDDAETEELKACLDIVPRDDIAINVESLATKYPIIFNEMLDDFDRQDMVDLYSLVKERYEIISPEGYDRLLWGDLITLVESSEEDKI